MHPQPPRRTFHAYGTPINRLVYDRWGRCGRPVVLLHGLGYDRTMWWPVAAELGDSCAAVAVDLPGHGESAPRDDYAVDRLAHDLAMLVSRLELHRAPVLVAHAEAALLADTFAQRYATQAVISVDVAPGGGEEPDLSGVPPLYRQFAVRRVDRQLLRAYRSWHQQPTTDLSAMAVSPARVRVGAAPEAHLGSGSFPHLRDPAGFAALLRTLR
ncbi:pimeloyl-ACP methyl ester carboxylesterase [Actinoplanes octamycinicus]|uniref:Pimeloyl-ACP methyl ester carboxylesterase n=1 Tax=Actinoplanes octamycinicus TaxID=135948 RepID=A0A7W7M9Q6_9ACTN|nr:alpha/beta fold hydrolase [Actinoplanes octamycinicus]MBB4742065.1 pimeloyl-ACP methyl ester carboxylesterase [Actinoplanes octamycinicus]GIE63699.1 hypothetical protein Aoc01nite_91010 [Actinoplanes octamycinicus]